jgi:SAM-dependent methyltransferase
VDWHSEKIADTSDEVRSRHQGNRAAWNEGAQSYTKDNEERVELLRSGKSNLHPVERANLERIGPLKQWCERAIHLQCASGYDTLSLILEGAKEVIGVDISDVHIENAKWTTAQLKLPARWYCCDVLATPAELDGTADLVYTGRGAINWLHDIDAWASVVFRLLREGGVLSLLEDHPTSWLFANDTTRLKASGVNYFTHAEWSKGWPDEYIGALDKAVEEQATKHERLWKIADVFQALVKAGLVVGYLGEHPDEYWPAFPKLAEEEKAKIPLTYSMVVRKPK